MPDKKTGRPKARRKFKWDPKGSAHNEEYGCWMENTNYKPGAKKKDQPEPNWVSANVPPSIDKDGNAKGKPLPAGESWGQPPDASKFLRIWMGANSIEDVAQDLWWCSVKQLRSFRSEINSYLEPKGFKKIKILRSRRHLFGTTGARADSTIKKLLKDGVITYVSADARNKGSHS